MLVARRQVGKPINHWLRIGRLGPAALRIDLKINGCDESHGPHVIGSWQSGVFVKLVARDAHFPAWHQIAKGAAMFADAASKPRSSCN
jgi:hypothetical protein